jgi:hypothetical protein
MRIDPVEKSDEFDQLTPLEKGTRIASIMLAFVGVFVWAVKILFF